MLYTVLVGQNAPNFPALPIATNTFTQQIYLGISGALDFKTIKEIKPFQEACGSYFKKSYLNEITSLEYIQREAKIDNKFKTLLMYDLIRIEGLVCAS